MRLWDWWKKYGGLPFQGELFDQPAPITEAILIFEDAFAQRPATRPLPTEEEAPPAETGDDEERDDER